MNKARYKLTLAVILSTISISYFNYDHEYTPEYEILDESNIAYGKYSNGLVYIGDDKFLYELKDVKPGDILIDENEKSMRILASYRIKDKDLRNEIINILKEYEVNNNTKHERSIESMRMEWYVHNLLYNFNIKKERTEDVDFENNEENIYNSKVLSKLLKI